MFNLEKSIKEWRQQMLAGGVKLPEVLDELETHLREDIAEQVKAGMAGKNAFENAVQRIGQPNPLRKEFSKIGPNWLLRRHRLKYALLRFLGVRAPEPSLETFSAGVQEALQLGGKEANAFHHHYIGTEHVLLGLLGTEAGKVSGALRNLGVDPAAVRREIEIFVGVGPEQPTRADLPLTPYARQALARAGASAYAQKQSSVGAEHVLLGLLETRGVASLVLKKLGVDVEQARQQLLRH